MIYNFFYIGATSTAWEYEFSILDSYKEKKMNNIILIGFMGAGKTVVGKLLSLRMNRPFMDTDQQIEKTAGCPVSEIFSLRGEEYFRCLEKAAIAEICSKGEKVVALGGGAFLNPDNRKICLTGQNRVIFLNASWRYISQRLEVLKQDRPLLTGRSEEEIKDLFYERQNAYEQSHIKVSIDNFKTFDDVAAHIIQLLS